MMKNKISKIILSFFFIFTLLSFFEIQTGASENYNDTPAYKTVIIDEEGLLTDEEEQELINDMLPLTEYGNAAFWTTSEYTDNEVDQARLKRKELFEFESAAILVINMNVRKLSIQSYGDINSYVTDSYARSITDNIKTYATDKNYYKCAQTAFSQMYDVCQKKNINEPLKISGYVVVSIMLGLILALGIAFSKKHNPLLQYEQTDYGKSYKASGLLDEPLTAAFVKQDSIHRKPTIRGTVKTNISDDDYYDNSRYDKPEKKERPSRSYISHHSSGGSGCGGCGSGSSSSF